MKKLTKYECLSRWMNNTHAIQDSITAIGSGGWDKTQNIREMDRIIEIAKKTIDGVDAYRQQIQQEIKP